MSGLAGGDSIKPAKPLPLMLGSGVGSELRHPLGVTLVGGLILSQWLTLFTTPVIYLQLDAWAQRRAFTA